MKLPSRSGIPIRFRLDRESLVTLVIEDAEGNRVRNLVSEARLAGGENTVWWDGYDNGEWDQEHRRPGVFIGTTETRGSSAISQARLAFILRIGASGSSTD